MTPFHYIFGISSLIGGLYLFVKLFLKKQPRPQQKENIDENENINKKNILLKICSVILILNGSYDLFFPNSERYNLISLSNQQWTEKDKRKLIRRCLDEAKNLYYKNINLEFCECAITKMINTMTVKEYNTLLKKPKEEQIEQINPLMQDCLKFSD